jgi:hypothetical protein
MSIEARTLHKVRIRILPFISVLFVVCFLDRINIGFAADKKLGNGSLSTGSQSSSVVRSLCLRASTSPAHRVWRESECVECSTCSNHSTADVEGSSELTRIRAKFHHSVEGALRLRFSRSAVLMWPACELFCLPHSTASGASVHTRSNLERHSSDPPGSAKCISHSVSAANEAPIHRRFATWNL